MNLERAYKNFFEKRADVPTPKLKNRHDSFRYPSKFKVDEANDRIFLPKLGWMRYRNSRKILGEVRNVMVSRQADKWFVSIQTRREVDLQPQKNGVVWIDLEVARFATFSDGVFVEPIDSFKKHEKRLKKAQKKLSKRRKAARTGGRHQNEFNAFTQKSPTSERTFCTSARPRSPKTTGSLSWKTCASRTCQLLRKVPRTILAKMSRPREDVNLTLSSEELCPGHEQLRKVSANASSALFAWCRKG
jgi:putative transposase